MILKIISENEVDTQENLKKLLEGSGIEVTQATLSRDIKELRLKKVVSESGARIYAPSERMITEIPQLFLDSVRSVDYAVNTVVFRCHTGMAQAACAVFDRLCCRGVVGTIAGDDTIFVLMRSESDASGLAEELSDMIGE